jgi:CRP/FNR family transcriptional regulator, cyclic AMP receptor protein
MEMQNYKAGQNIFAEGDPGDMAYLVQTGLVEISRTAGDKRLVLGRIGPGGLFGEMALIDAKPRMAAAQAIEETIAFLVPTEVFRGLLDATDPVVRKLVSALMDHTRSLSAQLAECRQKLDSSSKVVHYRPTTLGKLTEK